MSETTQRDGLKSRPFFSKLSPSQKLWLFRMGAGLLVLTPLLILEGILRWISPSWSESSFDPLVGFTANHPLFELNSTHKTFQIRKERLRSFAQNGFQETKGKNTFRIFCLGGSTVQGRPYSVETAFTTWLRIALETAYPERDFEVVNCGGVSYASYRLIPILQECLTHYEPDLLLICTGNNEFLEDRTYTFIKKATPVLEPILLWASRSKVIQSAMCLGSRWTRSGRPEGSTLGPQVNAMLDYDRGIERYHRNDQWKTSVEDHFQININRMLRICRDHDVPTMLLSPCYNLKDSPPFKSENRSDLLDDQKLRWSEQVKSASESMTKDLDSAISFLQQALAIDNAYAATWYALGQVYLQKSRFQFAKQSFQRALEQDICPLRITDNMRTRLKQTAKQWNVPFYDLQETATQHSPFGIPGNEFLIDHVHPTIHGHQLIGKELAQRIQSKWLKPSRVTDLANQSKTAFEDHLNSVPDVYFLIGLERLKGLRAWTQGRAEGAPIESHPDIPNGI